ncbi:MAG TPA: tRNA (adenosine(37)-N6)-threonylcarbamoyltransferase complex ATPase subunit type 1 TsaE [Candidatus Bathyarchaeia archaeon]|nr:tRNA (adenosine(37)-N6)-threonylcarbamoyltransferase complex ATPase subunit type 1 TsaE [Candidatus Bathyarchaeia archaeon]
MNNKDFFITNSSRQTQKLGELLARELKGGEIICLTGDLGSGKTTFAQGVLRGLGAKGPYTSPTFVVMKQYQLKAKSEKRKTTVQNPKPESVYHMDSYRVSAQDVLDLGWEEIISGENNIVIVEWAERIKSIVQTNAIWIDFKHLKDSTRKIIFSAKRKTQNAKLQLKTKK